MKRINVKYMNKDVRLLNQGLLKNQPNGINIISNELESMTNEVSKSNNPKLKNKIAKPILKSYLSNKIGIFLPNIYLKEKHEYDLLHIYNRILISKTPFIMELENGSAFLHYQPEKFKSLLKPLINTVLCNDNLKKIVGISRASMLSFEQFLDTNNYKNKEIIMQKLEYNYPIVPKNENITLDKIKEKQYKDQVDFLFISTLFDLKGGKELVDAFERINRRNKRTVLTIISRKRDIPEKYFDKITSNENIVFVEATLDRERLYEQYYSKADVFVVPTFRDSFGLVFLEALKSGLPIISTDTFAIPEMVIDGYNGFTTHNALSFFNKDFTWNKQYWGDNLIREIKNIYCKELFIFLAEKMNQLVNNQELRIEMSINSYNLSEEKFHNDIIKEKWKDIYYESLNKRRE